MGSSGNHVFVVLLPSQGHLCLVPQAVAIFRLAFPLSYNIWFSIWVREAFRGLIVSYDKSIAVLTFQTLSLPLAFRNNLCLKLSCGFCMRTSLFLGKVRVRLRGILEQTSSARQWLPVPVERSRLLLGLSALCSLSGALSTHDPVCPAHTPRLPLTTPSVPQTHPVCPAHALSVGLCTCLSPVCRSCLVSMPQLVCHCHGAPRPFPPRCFDFTDCHQ